jgi:hypothetical protein
MRHETYRLMRENYSKKTEKNSKLRIIRRDRRGHGALGPFPAFLNHDGLHDTRYAT